MWWEDKVREDLEKNKVVVKLYDEVGDYSKSIVIPTLLYPLNGKLEVFKDSKKPIKEITDEKLLEIFDSVPYKIGFCYQNTKALVEKLVEAGYNAKSYAGWLFPNSNETPVHHCWCVLDGMVLDLADDYIQMLSYDEGRLIKAETKQEAINAMADYVSYIKENNIPNRERCFPVGNITPFLYYVGCPCDPDEARRIYQNLMQKFPNHECERNCDENGVNPTQKELYNRGLI